jgi:hypothetical protein
MQTYKVTLEIKSDFNPRKWNWYEMLDPWGEGEDLISVDIEEMEEANA